MLDIESGGDTRPGPPLAGQERPHAERDQGAMLNHPHRLE